MADYYTIEFRIYGKFLDLAQTSKLLGLVPTTTQTMHEHAYSDKRFEECMWGFGQKDGAGIKEWSLLDTGISSLLDKLLPLKKEIEMLQRDNETVLWCGHFHEDFGSGPILSPKLLARIVGFGLGINISTYFSGNTKEEVSRV